MTVAENDPVDWEAYVATAAAVHGITLDDSRLLEVVLQMRRIHEMARSFLDHPLPDEVEPAPVFRP